ncbi:unnamed protein product [Staurois parvus]|uniref:Uncharacterized protein n=1 Tax=Staurois parvus TaxID=386267 RepID=A0ABN9CS50_9NEOB|nr:unnamed protein product [Staurois parvus]
MRGDQRVNCVLGVFTRGWCQCASLMDMLLCISLHSREIQNSMLPTPGEHPYH